MQYGIYYDQTRCIGCHTCEVACKDNHDIAPGPVRWRRIKEMESGVFPNPFYTFLIESCFHCVEPLCMHACPTKAINKRQKDGIVVVDKSKCSGCRDCFPACPYGAPQFASDKNAKMQMCNFCVDLFAPEEEPRPICVASCPARALDAGPMDILIAKYGEVKKATGFTNYHECNPSIIFRSKEVL